jgi:hypothetical protein
VTMVPRRIMLRGTGRRPGPGWEFSDLVRGPIAAARMGWVAISTADLWHRYGRARATGDRTVPGTSLLELEPGRRARP